MNNNSANVKALHILSVGHLVSDTYGGFIIPIMPMLALKLHIPLDIVGLLFGISSLSSSLSQPLFGYISDFARKRFFIIWGIIFSSFFISLTGVAENVWILGVVMFFGNMGVGLFHPQATAFAGYLSGKEIDRYMGTFSAAGTIGYAVGPFFSSLLVQNFGIESTIYAILPGIIITYFLYSVLPKIHTVVDRTKKAAKHVNVFKLKPVIYVLLLIAIVRALIITSYDIFMPFVWEKQGISVLWIGIFIALFSFLGGIASYIGGRLSNYMDRRIIMQFSLIPSIPCLLGALHLVKTMPVVSFTLFVIAGFIIMSSNSVNLVMAQKASPENLGFVLGMIGGFSWGVIGLIQSPIGFLCSKFGIIQVLSVIALSPILAAISVNYISKDYS